MNEENIEEAVVEAPVVKKATKKPVAPIPLSSPVKGAWKVSCSFQCHKDRTPPSQLPGTDIVLKMNTPVYAAHNGIITVVDKVDDSASGRWVRIKGAKGVVTSYLHLNKIAVKVGQRVAKGSLIGHSGNSGASTGPHLHFSMSINGKLVDPDKYI